MCAFSQVYICDDWHHLYLASDSWIQGISLSSIWSHLWRRVRIGSRRKKHGLSMHFTCSIMGSRPQKPFEFPDGYNNMFGVERYKIPESLFQPQQFLRKVIESNWDHAAKVSCKLVFSPYQELLNNKSIPVLACIIWYLAVSTIAILIFDLYYSTTLSSLVETPCSLVSMKDWTTSYPCWHQE